MERLAKLIGKTSKLATVKQDYPNVEYPIVELSINQSFLVLSNYPILLISIFILFRIYSFYSSVLTLKPDETNFLYKHFCNLLIYKFRIFFKRNKLYTVNKLVTNLGHKFFDFSLFLAIFQICPKTR